MPHPGESNWVPKWIWALSISLPCPWDGGLKFSHVLENLGSKLNGPASSTLARPEAQAPLLPTPPPVPAGWGAVAS